MEIFKLRELTMPPSLLDFSSCPACLHQVEVLTDTMMIVTHLILTDVVHQCNKIYILKPMILLINIRWYTLLSIVFATVIFYLFISFFTSTRMSFSASLTKPPLCFTCWSPGLPLHCWPLLLWPMSWELHTLMCSSWLNHWSWILAVNTLPCRRLWQRRWVVSLFTNGETAMLSREK